MPQKTKLETALDKALARQRVNDVWARRFQSLADVIGEYRSGIPVPDAQPGVAGFLHDAAAGVGSMAVYGALAVPGAVAAKALAAPAAVAGVASMALPAAAAMASGIDQVAQEVEQFSAENPELALTPQEQYKLAAKWGAISGLVDVAPLPVVFKLIPPQAKNKVARYLLEQSTGKGIATAALAEGLAEGAGQAIRNAAATTYNPDKEWSEGVAYDASVAGTAAALINMAIRAPGATARGVKRLREGPSAQAVPDVDAGTFMEATRAGTSGGTGDGDGEFRIVPADSAEAPSQAVPLPGASALPSKAVSLGAGMSAFTPDNQQRIETELAVVELADVVASHHLDGKPNPAYPAELQPRDRSRAASGGEIRSIAANINPDMLKDNSMTNVGAPVLDDRLRVESGNGRIMGMRKAAADNTLSSYRDAVVAEASRRGVDVTGFDNPVLVRIRRTPLSDKQRARFVVASNESPNAAMNAVDLAKADLQDQDAATLAEIKTLSGGVDARGNLPVVKRFIAKMNPFQHGAMLTKNQLTGVSELSDAGKRRLEAAIVYAAYGNDRLLMQVAETDAEDGKRLLSALADAAPGFARLRARGDVVLPDLISDASDLLAEVRRSPDHQTLDELLAQPRLDGGEPAADVLAIARQLEQRKRSGAKQGAYLKALASRREQDLDAEASGAQTALVAGGEVTGRTVADAIEAAGPLSMDWQVGGRVRLELPDRTVVGVYGKRENGEEFVRGDDGAYYPWHPERATALMEESTDAGADLGDGQAARQPLEQPAAKPAASAPRGAEQAPEARSAAQGADEGQAQAQADEGLKAKRKPKAKTAPKRKAAVKRTPKAVPKSAAEQQQTTSTPAVIAEEASKADANPSDAQKEAGNYSKGHIRLFGMHGAIENAKGSERSGTSAEGEQWSVTMPAHYGYLKRTEGADGDQLDIYVNDVVPDDAPVFVVDQYDADTAEFDEHKVFVGWRDEAAVKRVYDAAFDDGRGAERRKGIAKMTPDEFKAWVGERDALTTPVGARSPKPVRKPRPVVKPNTMFTAEKHAANTKRVKEMLSRMGSSATAGIDTELMTIGAEMAAYHIERGARTFAAYAKAMAGDLGGLYDRAKPYLRSFYDAIRSWPGAAELAADMTPFAELEAMTASGELDRVIDAAGEVQPGATDEETSNGSSQQELAGDVPGDGRGSEPGLAAVSPPQRRPGASDQDGGGTGEQPVRPADAPAPKGRPGPRRRSDARTDDSRGGDIFDLPRDSSARPRPKSVPARTNYVIADGALEATETRSVVAKADGNLAAISVLRDLQRENRGATAEEQATLVQYVGWGGIKGMFEHGGRYGKDFKERGPKLKALLSEAEYRAANRSIQYAHYTSETVLRWMWRVAERFGFDGGRVFEPGAGIGHFIGTMPSSIAGKSTFTGIEIDPTSAAVGAALYPNSRIAQRDFQETTLPNDSYDLVIGNPPFSDLRLPYPDNRPLRKVALADYFLLKSLDAVRPGGMLMFVVSAGLMNKKDSTARQLISQKADLLGGVRLPGSAFAKSSNTSVTTDILMFRKRLAGEQSGDESWVQTVDVTLPGVGGALVTGLVNRYFVENPNNVLGTPDFNDPLIANRYSVKAKEGVEIEDALNRVIEGLPESVMTPRDETSASAGDIEVAETAEETKSGSYFERNGRLYVMEGDKAVPLANGRFGNGKKLTRKTVAVIKSFVRLRNALRPVMAANLAHDDVAGDAARKVYNHEYDMFVQAHGPINKVRVQQRRRQPGSVEKLFAKSRERARESGAEWRDGSFDPTPFYATGASNAEIARARDALRRQYSSAGKHYDDGTFDFAGHAVMDVEVRDNIRAFSGDPEWVNVAATEDYDGDTGASAKGPMFVRNVLAAPEKREIKTVNDAVLVALNRDGRFTVGAVAEIYGADEGQVVAELGDRVYRDPDGGEWALAEEYLSGDVRSKLRAARAAAEADNSFDRNVEALALAMPAEVAASDITVKVGTTWVPVGVYATFAKEVLHMRDATFVYTAQLGWRTDLVDGPASRGAWGTDSMSAGKILDALMQGKKLPVYYPGKERSLNRDATAAVAQKMAEIEEAFGAWLWSDADRAQLMQDLYNETYNSLVPRKYDGSYLQFEGMAADFTLYPHQRNAVARIVSGGSTYVNHAVGAGKTTIAIASVMEARRLGLAKKPMIVVPGHVLHQFATEFLRLYPSAKVRIADEENFHTDRRRQFVSSVAQEDVDAVIISQDAFRLVPLSLDFVKTHIGRIVAEIKAAAAGDSRSDFQRAIERIERQLLKRDKRADKNLTFESLGVDLLVVDEAQRYRKVPFGTADSRQSGVDPSGNGDGTDMYLKALYLDSVNPGRGLVFMSGTPLTNTIGEAYTLMRLFFTQGLRERQIADYDAWFKLFGAIKFQFELKPDGRWAYVSRVAEFVNIAELKAMLQTFMDTITQQQVNRMVTVPAVKRETTGVQANEQVFAVMAWLRERLAAIKERGGRPEPGEDNHLVVLNDGILAALDYRLVAQRYPHELDPPLGDAPPSKVDVMIDKVFEIWKSSANQGFHLPTAAGYSDAVAERGPATQMIFSDHGLNGVWNVPDYVRAQLIDRGVPDREIAYIGDYNRMVDKARLFNDMNRGKIRILIGSSEKMGTGVNAQQRLLAAHFLDPLWLASSDVQRMGRIVRQRNMNREVMVFDYVTEGTMDATMFGTMMRKIGYFSQLFSANDGVRNIGDVAPESAYSQAQAIATGTGKALDLAKKKQALNDALVRRRTHERNAGNARRALATVDSRIVSNDREADNLKADIERRQPLDGDKFRMTVEGTEYAKRADANMHLLRLVENGKAKGDRTRAQVVGTAGGFDIKLAFAPFQTDGSVAPVMGLAMANGRTLNIATKADIVASIVANLRNLDGALQNTEAKVSDLKKERQTLAGKVGDAKPFAGNDEIESLRDDVKRLELELEAETIAPKDTWERVKDVDGNNAYQREQGGAYETETELLESDMLAGAYARHYTPVRLKSGGWGVRRSTSVADEPAQPQMSLRRSGTSRRGTTVDRIKMGTDGQVAQWADGPDVLIVQSVADLPAHLAAGAEADGGVGDIEGLYDPSGQTVYLVADNIASVERARQVLAHEVVGHYGIVRLLGEDYEAFLGEVGALARRDPRVRRLREEVVRAYGGAQGEALVNAEVIAKIAEAGLRMPLMTRVVAKVRRFLRQLGFDLQLSYADVVATLAAAGRAMRVDVASPQPSVVQQPEYAAPSATFGHRLGQLLPEGRRSATGAEWDRLIRRSDGIVRPFELDVHDHVGSWLRRAGARTVRREAVVARAQDYNVSAVVRLGDEGATTVSLEAAIGGAPLGEATWRATSGRLGDTLQLVAIEGGRLPFRFVLQEAVNVGADAVAWPRSLGLSATARSYFAEEGMGADVVSAGPGMQGVRVPRQQAEVLFDHEQPVYSRRPNEVPWHHQPLDRIMRLPFRALGGVDADGRWNPGVMAVDAIKKAKNTWTPDVRFVGPLVEAWRANFVDRAGQSEAYKARDHQRKTERNAVLAILEQFLGDFAALKLSGADAVTMFKLLEGREVHASEPIKRLAGPLRAKLDALGKELVEVGLLSEAAYERNLGTYLHRSYLKFEAAKRGLPMFGRRGASNRLRGDELMPRGMKLNVRVAAMTRELPEDVRERVDGKLPDFQWDVWQRRDNKGRVTKRVFVPTGYRALPPEGKGWTHLGGGWRVASLNGANAVLRRDFTEDEQVSMGKIQDVRYAAIETLLLLADDLSTGRFYRDLAENPEWSSDVERPGWRRIPKGETVPNTTVNKWGALAGRWVPEWIWRDLKEVDRMSSATWWDNLVRFFKISKTAMNPVVHFNNVMANVAMTWMHGMSLSADVIPAFFSLLRKDDLYRMAKADGVFGHTYVANEIIRDVADPVRKRILKELMAAQQRNDNSLDGMVRLFSRIWQVAVKGKDVAVGIYQLEDEVFRLAYYRRRLSLGGERSQVARRAIWAFMNYDVRAKAINYARRKAFPFIAYMYRALPMMAELSITHPWRLAKLAILFWGIEQVFIELGGGDDEEDRRTMHERDRGLTWMQIPFTSMGLNRRVRMPWRDAQGNPVYLDADRMVPGGDLFEAGSLGVFPGVPQWLQVGGPFGITMEMLFNASAFTGEPIYDDTIDSTPEQLAKLAEHGAASILPAWTPVVGWTWKRWSRAITGERDVFGRQYSVPAAALYGFGLKFKSHDVAAQRRYRMLDLRERRQRQRAKFRRAAMDHRRGSLSKRGFERAAEQYRDEMQTLAGEAAALLPGGPRR